MLTRTMISNRGARRALHALIVVGSAIVMAATAIAQVLDQYGLKRPDMEQLEPEVRRQITEILQTAQEYDEQRDALDTVLGEFVLPDEIRKKLTVSRAEVAGTARETVALYESLLDDSNPLMDPSFRARIISAVLITEGFGTPLERLERFDRLMEPLLAIPKNEFDSKAIAAAATYADAVRSLGYRAAQPLLEPKRIEGSHAAREALAAQVKLYYALKSKDILVELMDLVQSRIDERKPGSPPQNPLGRSEPDRFANKVDSLQWKLDAVQKVIDLSIGHLERNGEEYSESTALWLIEEYNLKSPEPLPPPEIKSEAEISAEQAAKDVAREEHLQEVRHRSAARISVDSEREYEKRRSVSALPDGDVSQSGFGAPDPVARPGATLNREQLGRSETADVSESGGISLLYGFAVALAVMAIAGLGLRRYRGRGGT